MAGSVGEPKKDPGFAGLIAVLGVIAGVLLWILTIVLSRSNLSGMNALFETYFPIGALDASRGTPKGPDAIIDTRSLPPGVPVRYTYELGDFLELRTVTAKHNVVADAADDVAAAIKAFLAR